MKGIIFNIVEEVVEQLFGPEAWDGLLATAALDGAYTSLGSYPDSDLVAIVDAAAAATRLSPADVLRTVGSKAIPQLRLRYPQFFDAAPDVHSFVLSLNTIIHPEVRKLYSGAGCPHFHFVDAGKTLTLGYNSPRRLCHLAEGFVTGLAAEYGETIAIAQTRCMHEGANACSIQLSWQ